MAFYSRRFKNNDYNHAITIPNKENNITSATKAKLLVDTWMLKKIKRIKRI